MFIWKAMEGRKKKINPNKSNEVDRWATRFSGGIFR